MGLHKKYLLFIILFIFLPKLLYSASYPVDSVLEKTENLLPLLAQPQEELKSPLPVFFDVRDILENPEKDFPPYNQKRLKACTPNAVAAAIQFMYLKNGLPNDIPSRLFIYYNARKAAYKDKNVGVGILNCINAVITYGVCSEKLWPYFTGTNRFIKRPTVECYKTAKQNIINIPTCFSKLEPNLDDIKSILVKNIPIITTISLYESFKSAATKKTGLVIMPDVQKEKYISPHTVLIMGYDDITNLFIIRNSWGAKQGDKGYYYLPYDYILSPELTKSLFWLSF